MDEKYGNYIRYTLFGLGGIFIILFLLNLSKIINLLLTQNISNLDLTSISFIPTLIYLILVYICLKIAFNWTQTFKSLTKTLVSIAILCLTIFFLLIPVANNSQEIVDSIQPTIDTILVSAIDEIINEKFPNENKELLISLAENSEIITLENNNLDEEKITLITQIFDLEGKSYEEQEIFTKIFITSIYEELSKTPQALEVPLPINEIKNMVSNQIDIELLKQIDISMIENFYSPNENAKINILVSENVISKSVNPSSISNEDINLIWNNLKLNNNLSNETKKKYISLILSQTIKSLEEQNINLNIAIPISSLSPMIPEDIKSMLSYDLFANDTQIRIKSLNELRNNCKKSDNLSEYSNQICEAIVMTEYDTLMKNINSLTKENEELFPLDITQITDSISSKENINQKLKGFELLAYEFLIGTIVLFFAAFGTYFLHFKLFNRELISIHIPYYISKINLISFSINYIILFLVYLIINKDLLLNLIKENPILENVINLDTLINLPIFEIIKLINSQMITYATLYLVISISLFGALYFMQSRAIDNNYSD